MKLQALKAEQYCLFGSSTKYRKGFSKINDGVKSYLQNYIIYHPRFIQSLIVNYCTTVKFDDVN